MNVNCSFCDRSNHDPAVFAMVSHRDAYICDRCIDECAVIVREKRDAARAEVDKLSVILGAAHV